MKIEIEITDEQLEKIADRVAMKIRAGMATTYSTKEAAHVLGVSSKTVSRRIEAGLIPVIPNIRPPRIPAAFIDRLVNPDLGS